MNELTCPKCETLLKRIMTEKGMLWLCETCAGLAVNVAVLRKYLNAEMAREFWLKATPGAGIETPFIYENETVGGMAYLCLEALCEVIRLFLFRR